MRIGFKQMKIKVSKVIVVLMRQPMVRRMMAFSKSQALELREADAKLAVGWYRFHSRPFTLSYDRQDVDS